jgi:26S proteasome regulatory subunit N5
VEKQTRLASDAFATGKVAVAIVQILFECKDWEGLNSNIVLISKRRQQLKQVLVDMVQEVCESEGERESARARARARGGGSEA